MPLARVVRSSGRVAHSNRFRPFRWHFERFLPALLAELCTAVKPKQGRRFCLAWFCYARLIALIAGDQVIHTARAIGQLDCLNHRLYGGSINIGEGIHRG